MCFADRLSNHGFWANFARLFFSCLAYEMFLLLKAAIKRTKFEAAKKSFRTFYYFGRVRNQVKEHSSRKRGIMKRKNRVLGTEKSAALACELDDLDLNRKLTDFF